jgi:hypothetical protein
MGSSARRPTDQTCPDPAPTPQPIDEVEFVHGPWAGRHEARSDLPGTIAAPAGTYQRSVRCADDGAMRYVWQGPGSDALERPPKEA